MERIPQGILDKRVASSRFELSRHEPAPSLRPFVEYYWIVRWDLPAGGHHEQRVLPNVSVHVVFGSSAAGIWGPRHDVFTYRLEGTDQVLGVRLRPGCSRSLLRRPASELTDRVVPLADVLGTAAEKTERAIRGAQTTGDMVALADELLGRDVPNRTAAEERARAAVGRIATDPRITRVRQLSAATGLTMRTLQRLFLDYVGVSPKWAIRAYRLGDAATRVAAEPDLDYAALAAELGYSDQSHFTRDFTAAVGRSPAAYGREQLHP